MIIEWGGVEYDYDPQLINVRTAIIIHDHTGHGMISWTRGIDDANPVDLQGLLYAMKVQNGERPNIKVLDFNPVEFYTVIAAAYQKDLAGKVQAAAEEVQDSEDPTVPAST